VRGLLISVPDELNRSWELEGHVALRPERFGALAYDYRTRRLSFLKSPKLVAVVEDLERQPTGYDACVAAGVTAAELPAFTKALAQLAATGVIRERTSEP
jgi:putative mycofactocin binding protein MftB